MVGRQSRMLVSALVGLLIAALVTGCCYILLVAVSLLVPIPGAASISLITLLLLGIFAFTFVVSFRKLAGIYP